MSSNNKDFEAFASKYEVDEKEILVLTDDSPGGGVGFRDSLGCIQYFLAYINIPSNELKKGDGRITWLISNEEYKNFGFYWPHHFKKGAIYRLKVRELIDKTVPEGRLPSFYNRFMVVDVLEENVENDELLAILNDYRMPKNFVDKTLGKFEFDRIDEFFAGKIELEGRMISLTIYHKDNLETLRLICENLNDFVEKASRYAAMKLLEIGNQWQEDAREKDDKSVPLTEDDFVKRISLNEIVIDDAEEEGEYTLWFSDGDIFWGHVITVSGNIKSGFTDSNIEG